MLFAAALRLLDQALRFHVEGDFCHPGKPPANARVKSFNGRFRQECLNAQWFL
jgi:hypothetical protein